MTPNSTLLRRVARIEEAVQGARGRVTVEEARERLAAALKEALKRPARGEADPPLSGPWPSEAHERLWERLQRLLAP